MSLSPFVSILSKYESVCAFLMRWALHFCGARFPFFLPFHRTPWLCALYSAFHTPILYRKHALSYAQHDASIRWADSLAHHLFHSAKSFERVQHISIPYKLEAPGISGRLSTLVGNLFTGRSLVFEAAAPLFDHSPILNRLLQGSPNCPLPLPIYLNDLFCNIPGSFVV